MLNSIRRTFGFINDHPIARRNKLTAYWRFFKWQLVSGIFQKKFFVFSYIGNTRMFARKHLTGITGSIYTGLHEFAEMSFLLHLLDDMDCFFDVGANVGSYTILAAGVKGSKCLAFEPAKETFEILERNIVLNRVGNLVECQNKGVGSKREVLRFSSTLDTANHVISEDDDITSTEFIDIVPLDEYYPLYKPCLLKIDVEGFEAAVINGSEKLLRSPTLKAIIIELNGCGARYNNSDQAIHNKLKELSFLPFTYDPFKRQLRPLKTYGTHNTIYIRDIDFVKMKISKSPAFEVFNHTCRI